MRFERERRLRTVELVLRWKVSPRRVQQIAAFLSAIDPGCVERSPGGHVRMPISVVEACEVKWRKQGVAKSAKNAKSAAIAP